MIWHKFFSSNSLFNSPSTGGKSSLQCEWFKSNKSSPLRNSFCHSVECYEYVAGSIGSLVNKWNPYAVFFAVLPVYVFALYRESIWTFAHVEQEVFKTINPFFAYGYSSSSIVFVGALIFVIAAALHSAPNFVLFGVSKAMCFIDVPTNLGLKTSTRFCSIVSKVSCINSDFFAAVTNAMPSSDFRLNSFSLFNNKQSLKSLTT